MDTNANTKLYDKALDRSAMLRLYERRVANKVSAVLEDHHKRLDGVFEGTDLKDKNLLAAVDKELIKTFKEAKNVTETSFLSLVADQLSYTYQLIENSIGHIWRTERPAKRVAEELVLKKPLYKDKTLAAGWSNRRPPPVPHGLKKAKISNTFFGSLNGKIDGSFRLAHASRAGLRVDRRAPPE